MPELPKTEILSGHDGRSGLVAGGADALLPHLLAQFDNARRCDIAVSFLLDSGARLIVEHLRSSSAIISMSRSRPRCGASSISRAISICGSTNREGSVSI
jgi:hypothetical protein